MISTVIMRREAIGIVYDSHADRRRTRGLLRRKIRRVRPVACTPATPVTTSEVRDV
jgi:hypothetical protein